MRTRSRTRPSSFRASAPIQRAAGRSTRVGELSSSRWRELIERGDWNLMLVEPSADARILDANPGACRLLGRSWRELVGRSVRELHPVDQRAAVPRVVADLDAGRTRDVDLWFERPDGLRVLVTVRAIPLRDEQGRVQVRAAQLIDRSERVAVRLAQEMHQHLLRWVDDAVIGCDAAGRITHFNPAAERLYGHAAAAVSGRRLDEVLPTQLVEDPAAEAPGSGPEVEHGYRRLSRITADGRRLDVESSTRAMLGEGGELLGYVHVDRDVTARVDRERVQLASQLALERRHAELAAEFAARATELERAQAALQQTEAQFREAQKLEAVGRLAGGIAHDSNNMLSVILSSVELLQQELAHVPEARADLENIHDAASRSTALTRQLLAFSRRQHTQPRLLRVGEVVLALDPLLRRLIGEDVALVLRLGDQGRAVHADPSQLEQVIMNLVVNSRDAMARGGRLILETGVEQLDVEQLADVDDAIPGEYVLLAVTDTGVGMDPSVMSRAFEPFFTTKPSGRGTGLGLATVYGIVRQAGGVIRAFSQPGLGTTMKVHLPVADEGESPTRPPPRSGTPRGGNETLLVVEDEGLVRRSVRRVLERFGYRVVEAVDGASALERLRELGDEVALVLTDLVMPGMNGRELARRVERLRPGLAVLFMSGYTDEDVLSHGELAADVDLVQKPFTPEALGARVREMLDRR
jgi:two-component system, cell cycle sensor histidine kinase and response regulator CckA